MPLFHRLRLHHQLVPASSGRVGPMRPLVPAASATLIAALALSAAAVSVSATTSVSATSSVSATTVPAADARPSSAGAVQPRPAYLRSEAPARAPGTAGTGAQAAPSGAHSAPSGTTRVTPRAVFGWPLSPRPAVLRRFDQPRDQWSPGHRGVDLVAAVGEPVLSTGNGVVAFSGMVAGRGVITIRHPGGLRTTYEPVDERLTSGAFVHRGSRIGVISAIAGHCVPLTCLHWGAISGQTYRDPLSLLGFARPILLPLG
jgi:murein DD-endopeptidase MepM/ murein hydrolase activator NlpD